jgi:four helix bundle protein
MITHNIVADSYNNLHILDLTGQEQARETKYWIDLLIATDYLNPNDAHTQSILDDSLEIIKMLTSIIKSAQKNSINN